MDILDWNSSNRLSSISTHSSRYTFSSDFRNNTRFLTSSQGWQRKYKTPKIVINNNKLVVYKGIPRIPRNRILESQVKYSRKRSMGLANNPTIYGVDPARMKANDKYWKNGGGYLSDPYYKSLAGIGPSRDTETVVKSYILGVMYTASKFANIVSSAASKIPIISKTPNAKAVNTIAELTTNKIGDMIKEVIDPNAMVNLKLVDNGADNFKKVTNKTANIFNLKNNLIKTTESGLELLKNIGAIPEHMANNIINAYKNRPNKLVNDLSTNPNKVAEKALPVLKHGNKLKRGINNLIGASQGVKKLVKTFNKSRGDNKEATLSVNRNLHKTSPSIPSLPKKVNALPKQALSHSRKGFQSYKAPKDLNIATKESRSLKTYSSNIDKNIKRTYPNIPSMPTKGSVIPKQPISTQKHNFPSYKTTNISNATINKSRSFRTPPSYTNLKIPDSNRNLQNMTARAVMTPRQMTSPIKLASATHIQNDSYNTSFRHTSTIQRGINNYKTSFNDMSSQFRNSSISFNRYSGPSSSSRMSPMPGGVLFDMAATISGENEGSNQIDRSDDGIVLSLAGAQITIPEKYEDDFVAILMTIYAGLDPGVTIEPGSTRNELRVGYFGKIEGRRMSNVLFEADRLLKCYTLGVDNITGYPMNPQIPGYRSVVNLSPDFDKLYLESSYRFWFKPAYVNFQRIGGYLVADDVRIVVKTEYLSEELLGKSDPAAQAFTDFFNENITEFAQLHEEIRELYEYAKLVGLAKYLRQNNVPVNWLILSHRFGPPVNTKYRTPGGTQTTETGIEVYGGVTYNEKSRYISARSYLPKHMTNVSSSSKSFTNAPPIDPYMLFISGESNTEPGYTYTLDDTPNSRSYDPIPFNVTKERKLWFQADGLATLNGNFLLDVTRYYDSSEKEGEFGPGWKLLIPYEIKPKGEEKTAYSGYKFPKRIIIKNRLNGEQLVMTFGKEKQSDLQLVGYFPEKKSNLRAVYLMTDGSFQLADLQGNTYEFSPKYKPTAINLGQYNRWMIGYNDKGQINTISDGKYAMYKFIYNKNNQVDRLRFNGNDLVNFNYDKDNKRLVKVEGEDGRIWRYWYSLKNELLFEPPPLPQKNNMVIYLIMAGIMTISLLLMTTRGHITRRSA